LPLPSQKPFRHNNSCCVSYFNDVYRTNHHGKPHRKNIGGRAFIAKTFKKVALIPYLRDRWLTCETWASAIKWHSTEAVNFDVNSGSVSSSLSRDNELSNYADRYKPGKTIPDTSKSCGTTRTSTMSANQEITLSVPSLLRGGMTKS
jgi:hypothetical protein